MSDGLYLSNMVLVRETILILVGAVREMHNYIYIARIKYAYISYTFYILCIHNLDICTILTKVAP